MQRLISIALLFVAGVAAGDDCVRQTALACPATTLAAGATTLMYEGAPNFPEPDRFWSIIERHRVSVFYTAPTAIRSRGCGSPRTGSQPRRTS